VTVRLLSSFVFSPPRLSLFRFTRSFASVVEPATKFVYALKGVTKTLDNQITLLKNANVSFLRG